MATINKEILIGTPQEKIFNFVNKSNNLLRIWPSLIEVKDEELLPNGGYSFTWVNKMIPIILPYMICIEKSECVNRVLRKVTLRPFVTRMAEYRYIYIPT